MARMFAKQPCQRPNLKFCPKFRYLNQIAWNLKLIKDLTKGFWPCECRKSLKMAIEWKEQEHGEEDEQAMQSQACMNVVETVDWKISSSRHVYELSPSSSSI